MPEAMDSRRVLEAIENQAIPIVEENPHYTIYDCVVKEYPATQFLVQSSGTPINLGRAMLPLMNTGKLWKFIEQHQIPRQENAPLEVYLYHWVDRAQGPMVFDVGTVVPEDCVLPTDSGNFMLKQLPAQKFASIIYYGPFPHEPNSGWGQIHWEDRAREKGWVYTQRLYRELYHLYDFDSHRHVTEVQIEIE